MSSADDRLALLFQRLEDASRPGLAKAPAPTLRELDKQRSRQKLQRACDAISPHTREAARAIGVSDRYLRDMLSGRNEVLEWIYYALPREGKLAWVACELDELESAEHRVAV